MRVQLQLEWEGDTQGKGEEGRGELYIVVVLAAVERRCSSQLVTQCKEDFMKEFQWRRFAAISLLLGGR